MYVKVRASGRAEVSPSPTLNKSLGWAFSGQFEGRARAGPCPPLVVANVPCFLGAIVDIKKICVKHIY